MRDFLLDDDFERAMAGLTAIPPRRAVNPLFSFFCSVTPLLRWRAVSGMGVVVSRLAETQMESARVVMRRLMWSLNDESGGIGWGAPEALGEITARHSLLAGEYAHILVSYIRPDGNFLEHPVLQRGLLWGLGRLAHAKPVRAAEALPFVRPFFGIDGCLPPGSCRLVYEGFPQRDGCQSPAHGRRQCPFSLLPSGYPHGCYGGGYSPWEMASACRY